MAQRVLAENVGVESVRYVLPNKHYIPVDMKYIGEDNSTPYVSRDILYSIQFFGSWIIVFGDYSNFGIRHLPRVVEQKMMGVRRGLILFLDRMPGRHLLIYYAVRTWSTDAHPLSIFFSLILDRMRRFSPQWTRRGE